MEATKFKKTKLMTVLLSIALLLTACTDADIASSNISKAADNFEIPRRIVFYNGITDKYMLTVEGRCSLGNADNRDQQLTVTCKVGEDQYKKHFLGLSDNVTYFAEHLSRRRYCLTLISEVEINERNIKIYLQIHSQVNGRVLGNERYGRQQRKCGSDHPGSYC